MCFNYDIPPYVTLKKEIKHKKDHHIMLKTFLLTLFSKLKYPRAKALQVVALFTVSLLGGVKVTLIKPFPRAGMTYKEKSPVKNKMKLTLFM